MLDYGPDFSLYRLSAKNDLNNLVSDGSAGTSMLWTAAIPTEFFVRIEDNCKLHVLDITTS
jgi:hypothetical protein